MYSLLSQMGIVVAAITIIAGTMATINLNSSTNKQG